MSDTTNRYKLLHELSSAQTKALELVDSGATHADAADAAGVDRTTVSRWASKHPEFIAELNRRKTERAHRNSRRLQELTKDAVSLLASAIEAGDIRVAIQWLKLVPLTTIVTTPTGPMTAVEYIENVRRIMPPRNDLLEDVKIFDGLTTERAMNVILEELDEASE